MAVYALDFLQVLKGFAFLLKDQSHALLGVLV